MLTHLGSLTLGACVPKLGECGSALEASLAIGAQANATLQAKVGPILAKLQAKLAAVEKAKVALTLNPPSIQAKIDALQKMIVALQAQLALGIPGVELQLAALVKLAASLTADLADLALDVDFDALLAVHVDFALDLSLLLGTPGIHAYQYTGPVSELGDELAAATDGGFPGGSGGDTCVAWVFAASDGGAVQSARAVFAAAA